MLVLFLCVASLSCLKWCCIIHTGSHPAFLLLSTVSKGLLQRSCVPACNTLLLLTHYGVLQVAVEAEEPQHLEESLPAS